jgi:putative ABC transport system substrate-binding protein
VTGPPPSARRTGRRGFVQGALAVMGGLALGCRPEARPSAPSARLPRVGYPTLIPVAPGQGDDFLDAFRQGLAEHGYTEGKNIAIELRDAGGAADQLPQVIQELVELPVEVFVLPLSNTVPMAVAATQTIPIVSTLIGDPVALGLAENHARPTANVTGLTVYFAPLTGKRGTAEGSRARGDTGRSAAQRVVP